MGTPELREIEQDGESCEAKLAKQERADGKGSIALPFPHPLLR
jgi:hypothetical protein